MSRRASAYVNERRPAKSPPEPNAQFPSITVDFRVFWPARAGNLAAALDAVDLAYEKVRRQIVLEELGEEVFR